MTASAPEPPDKDAFPGDEPWWRRYSRHGELPLSSGVSLACHLFLLLLIVVLPLLQIFRAEDRAPAQLDSIDVSDGTSGGPVADEGPSDGPLTASPAAPAEPVAPATPLTSLHEPVVEKPEEIVPTRETGSQAAASRSNLANIQGRMDGILSQLNQNLGQSGGGGGSTAGKGRPGRAARWILRFNTRSVQDYLAQIEGLGAAIAFPVSGSQLLYIHNPATNPRQEKRSTSQEKRIYWVSAEEDEQEVDVCVALGQPPSPFILFLPLELEERMLELELSYNNLAEDEILSTTFGVVDRGGRYDVVVLSQQPR